MALDRFPLFPLAMVLFPGTVVPLHIFEPRYRVMLSRILDGDRRFGLLHHDPDEDGPFLNDPGRVGTVAEVVKQQSLPAGRSLVLIRGVRRFVTREEVLEGEPFYEARVSGFYDLPVEGRTDLVERRRRSLALFDEVVQYLPRLPGTLPTFDPEGEVSFGLAATVQMDSDSKQELLEMRSEIQRLDRLDPLFRYALNRAWDEGWPDA